MKTLQIGNIDTAGGRFNGADLHRQLRERGIKSKLCVRTKKTNDNDTWELGFFFGMRAINFVIKQIEKLLSIQSILYPSSLQLYFDKRFLDADIVHYHLIHTGFFSLLTFPKLSQLKPSVWTLHDPWAMTGHCIHPFECTRWKTGCGKCPSLNTHIPMLIDNTKLMWKIKKWVYSHSNIDIVVASKWMLNMAKQSPLLSKCRIHYIPFGIDLNLFRPMNSKEAKKSLGIDPNSTVLAFRTTSSEFKGLPYIKECIQKLRCDEHICLLTVGEKNLIDEFNEKYEIVDLGWIEESQLAVFYNACDIFLMPSTAEAFGLMAIEAMACGKPVIVFEGTALPEVIFAPKGGIAVPQGDVDALVFVIEDLVINPKKRQEIGNLAYNIAKENYDRDIFIDRIIALYRQIIESRIEH
ncbi:MAG: glycosyltransferase [Methanomethylovorans sp.]|jgi:glycosyltransferase involved in cell wall biosynthesis|nr:glycosyltransferase [Methanomethylovorans sp.]